MNGYVGVSALGVATGCGGGAAQLSRDLTTLRVGLSVLDGCGADALTSEDLQRLVHALTETIQRLPVLVARPGTALA